MDVTLDWSSGWGRRGRRRRLRGRRVVRGVRRDWREEVVDGWVDVVRVDVGSQDMFCWLGTVVIFCIGAEMKDCICVGIGVGVDIDCSCCCGCGDCLNSVFGFNVLCFAPGLKLNRSNSSTLKLGSELKVLADRGCCAGGFGIGIDG